jgi:hypothetical protein
MAAATGLSTNEVAGGQIAGSSEITVELIAKIDLVSRAAADFLRTAAAEGADLCGALGDLRTRMGTIAGPTEASIPFVSNLAGILASAEVLKLKLRQGGVDAPVLDNVIQIDLARDYGRNDHVSFAEPPRHDCQLCQVRAAAIDLVRKGREGSAPFRTTT